MASEHDRASQDVARGVESLRQHRTRPDRNVRLTEELTRLAGQYERHASGLGRVAEVWQEIAPVELQKSARLKSLVRGVLTVCVTDASSRYLLDRSLRSGLRRELIRESPVTVRDVKIRVEPDEGR